MSLLGVLGIMGLAGTALGVGSSLISSNQTNKQNKGMYNDSLWASREEAELNRQFQADQARNNRQFADVQARNQREWETSERLNQFALSNAEYDRRLADERAYNSPLEQAKRLKEAGINPAVLGSSNSAMDSSFAPPTSQIGAGAAASAPSTPSGAMAQVPSPPYMPNNNFSNMANSIGSFIESLSRSGLNNAQKERITSLLGNEVELQLLELQGKDLVNKGLDIANFINNSTKNQQVLKAFQDVQKLKAENFLLGEQAGKVHEEKLHETEKRFLTIAQKNLTYEQYNLLLKQVYWYDIQQRSTLQLTRASINELNTRASLNTVNSGYIDTLTRLNILDIDVRKDPEVVKARKQEIIKTVDKIVKDANLSAAQREKVLETKKWIEKEVDWWEIKNLSREIRGILESAENLGFEIGSKLPKGKVKGPKGDFNLNLNKPHGKGSDVPAYIGRPHDLVHYW